MESPISSKEITLKTLKPKPSFFYHQSPSGFGKRGVSPHCCNCCKSHQNVTMALEEVEEGSNETSRRSYEVDQLTSTPLRISRERRPSSSSTDINLNPHGKMKTPATNHRKTPLKLPVNPFDAVLMDRLHLPMCSPSIFTTVAKTEDNEFKWNIDEQARLFPAPIEEELHIHHHVCENYDSDTESKLQAAIDRFYERRVIAPSPWTAAKKCGFERAQSPLVLKPIDDLDPKPGSSNSTDNGETKIRPLTQDCSTQTVLSLPFHLPSDLKHVLHKYNLLPLEESGSASSSIIGMESESFSTSTRRKLFDVEDLSMSQTPAPDVMLRSPSHMNSLLPQAAFSSPIKSWTEGEEFDDDVVGDEVHVGFLESSQTTFWRDMSSPSLSPISSQRSPPMNPSSDVGRKKKYKDMHLQSTPPSSRVVHKTAIPLSFSPLQETDEVSDDCEFSKGSADGKTPSTPDQISDDEIENQDPNSHSISNNIQQQTENNPPSVALSDTLMVSSFQNFTKCLSKHSTMTAVQCQQSLGAQERFDALEVDETCSSRMQDTGYQTVSMTTLPGASVSSNHLKLQNYPVMPMDPGCSSGNYVSHHQREWEDGYTSLSFHKIPQRAVYNDASMTDVWHSSAPPLASSTPAKNFTGFLM